MYDREHYSEFMARHVTGGKYLTDEDFNDEVEAGGRYQFPILDHSSVRVPTLEEAMSWYRACEQQTNFPLEKIYSCEKRRKTFCLLQLKFNLAGAPPPAFRNFQPALPAKGLNKWERLASNDRKVIDLHWCYCSHNLLIKLGIPSGTCASFGVDLQLGHGLRVYYLDGDSLGEFYFDDASELARRKWTSEHIAENLLELSRIPQLCMKSLRTKAMRETFRQANNAMKRVRKQMTDRANSRRSRLTLPDIDKRVRAARVLKLSGGSPSTAVALEQLIDAVRYDEANRRDRLKRLSGFKCELIDLGFTF